MRLTVFQMHGVSKEYCLEMILSHEPTESGKKRHELGIDGQCISILYMIRSSNKPVVSYVVDFLTGTVVNSRHDFQDFLGSSVAEWLGHQT